MLVYMYAGVGDRDMNGGVGQTDRQTDRQTAVQSNQTLPPPPQPDDQISVVQYYPLCSRHATSSFLSTAPHCILAASAIIQPASEPRNNSLVFHAPYACILYGRAQSPGTAGPRLQRQSLCCELHKMRLAAGLRPCRPAAGATALRHTPLPLYSGRDGRTRKKTVGNREGRKGRA